MKYTYKMVYLLTLVLTFAFVSNINAQNTFMNRQTNIMKNGHAKKVKRTVVPQKRNYAKETITAASGCANGHEYVNLGLSVKWATCNVGANSPEEYGDYYAWGETETKNDYSENTYKYFQSGSYTDIGDNISKTQYDVAHVKWGGNWRLPSHKDIQELCNKCIKKWVTYNGVNGYKFTGSNGNGIFLPAAGYRWDTDVLNQGSVGYYWSGTVDSGDSSDALYLYFDSGDVDPYINDYRYYGFSVRPVSE